MPWWVVVQGGSWPWDSCPWGSCPGVVLPGVVVPGVVVPSPRAFYGLFPEQMSNSRQRLLLHYKKTCKENAFIRVCVPMQYNFELMVIPVE